MWRHFNLKKADCDGYAAELGTLIEASPGNYNWRGSMSSAMCYTSTLEGELSVVCPTTQEDYQKGIAVLKNNKAAGRDYRLMEQQKTIGKISNKATHDANQILY